MQTALFHNFSSEPFTGYWNGKPHTFKAGQKKYMPDYLAAHFAKHLTNRELLAKGLETATSPKFPSQVPEFMELFNQACIIVENEEQDEAELETDLANRKNPEPSMNMPEHNSQPLPKGPSAEPQIVDVPEDDEDSEFEAPQTDTNQA